VAGRRAAAGLAAATLALTASGCGLGGAKTVTVTHTHTVTTTRTVTSKSAPTARPCLGADLAGSFAVVPGSAGAGQISYLLSLKNTSHSRCYVQGLPKAVLLGVTGSALPTLIRAAGGAPNGRIVLEPGASAIAQARFSPDVAGSGDSQSGACQPLAHTLEVTPNGGSPMDAAIKPPTSVCQRGTLNFEAFGYAG
jgi:hypothetical protein